VKIEVLVNAWPGYRLLDTGNRRKLEKFGDVTVIRSEPKAWWKPALPENEWKKAQAIHEDEGRDGKWRFKGTKPADWDLKFADKMKIRLKFMDSSKQIGLFPEQSPHWKWLLDHPAKPLPSGEKPRAINLFGYTGAASLALAAAGWSVTHVDASKPAVAWGRVNQELSGQNNAPIRWILEDAVKFVEREIRRGAKYEAILLDPPAFGRGPDGELWKIERDLPPLLDACRKLLSDKASLIILTVYTIDASSILCQNLLAQTTSGLGGKISIGELAMKDEAGDRLLPLSLWGRWER
jgi:23S rRNA (cytosine1962-C5)-methyltransferase